MLIRNKKFLHMSIEDVELATLCDSTEQTWFGWMKDFQFYHSSQWEEVPPDVEWTDVTHKIHIPFNTSVFGIMGDDGTVIGDAYPVSLPSHEYEFRKVEAYVIPENAENLSTMALGQIGGGTLLGIDIQTLKNQTTTVLQVWQKT